MTKIIQCSSAGFNFIPRCKYDNSFLKYQLFAQIHTIYFINSHKNSNFEAERRDMISRIVNKLLKTEKRITIPALGSFMKRNDGVIVFTDMLKDDDGVLARHVAAQMFVSTKEAQEDISKFTEQVNRNLRERGVAELSDLGLLTRNAQGKIVFISKDAADASTPQSSIEPAPNQMPKTVIQTETTPNAETNSPSKPTRDTTTPTPQKATTKDNSASSKPITRTPKRAPAPAKPTRDWVLISAIIAACIALACMAFGIFEGNVTSLILE